MYANIYFYDRFLSEIRNGLINDVEIVFIDKTDSSDLTRREELWSIKLKTFAPYEVWLLKNSLQVCVVSGSSWDILVKLRSITYQNVSILKWFFVVLLKDWYLVFKCNLYEAASLIYFVTCINHLWKLINLHDNCFPFNILM